jgi:tetratricopeptide (TPR) repeat protein
LDPDNPVVKLCVAGMQAESEGQSTRARDLFVQAWAACRDDFDACIAAHYVARHQERPEDTLHWNQEALSRADAVHDDRVRAFYPSLYLNLGHSYEELGNQDKARHYYELAATRLADLPASPYRDLVQTGITAGRTRTDPDP